MANAPRAPLISALLPGAVVHGPPRRADAPTTIDDFFAAALPPLDR